jgi:peptidoglycan L-alanyl-D-glutamate endopeptidase CwlK
MAQDNLTVDRIKLMHPKVREELLEQYLYANNKLLPKGVRLRFSYTLRTISEQNALYAQGRTKSGAIVTNARGGQSYHNYGLAFDIVLLYDLDGNGTFEYASWDITDPNWKKVVSYFKEQGWTHGGDFKSIKDYPHFEKSFGYSTRELMNRVSLVCYPDI